MPPQWGGEPQRPECIQARGQRASPHPQESKGTLTSGLLGKVPLGAQVWSPAVAHMSTGGRGLRGCWPSTRDHPPIPHCCLQVPQLPAGLTFSGSASSPPQCRAPTCPSPPASCPPPQPAWPCAPCPGLLTDFLTCCYRLPPERPQRLCPLCPPRLENVFLCPLCSRLRRHHLDLRSAHPGCGHLSWGLPGPGRPPQRGCRGRSSASSHPALPLVVAPQMGIDTPSSHRHLSGDQRAGWVPCTQSVGAWWRSGALALRQLSAWVPAVL